VIRLAALATGAGVPAGGFAGVVAHVFPRVCLLALSDQRLLTLATSPVGHLPGGITLDTSAEFLLCGRVAAGSEFAARGGILRFAGGGLSVDLRGALRWRCDLAGLRLDIDNPDVERAWRAARAALRRDGRSGGLERAAAPAIRQLVSATRSFAAAAADVAIRALVGLGDGTTPAGDDFLVGYLAGLFCSTTADEARTLFVLTLCRRIEAAAARTHRVSRAYLEAAAGGQVSERLYTLAVRVAAGADGAALALAVRTALAVGHCSGACGVLGLLIGCTVWPGAAGAKRAALSPAPHGVDSVGSRPSARCEACEPLAGGIKMSRVAATRFANSA